MHAPWGTQDEGTVIRFVERTGIGDGEYVVLPGLAPTPAEFPPDEQVKRARRRRRRPAPRACEAVAGQPHTAILWSRAWPCQLTAAAGMHLHRPYVGVQQEGWHSRVNARRFWKGRSISSPATENGPAFCERFVCTQRSAGPLNAAVRVYAIEPPHRRTCLL